MSLYNILFGVNDDMPILLGMIEQNTESFSRFRDVFLKNDGKTIIVYTRTGGGNRKEYEQNWKEIRQYKYYIKDYDDEFDSTYAYIEFEVPEKYKITAEKMFDKEPLNIQEKFNKEIKDMENPNSDASKRAEKIAQKIMNEIDCGNKYIEL